MVEGAQHQDPETAVRLYPHKRKECWFPANFLLFIQPQLSSGVQVLGVFPLPLGFSGNMSTETPRVLFFKLF